MGILVRFSANEGEIEALLRFCGRRAPGGLLGAPLAAAHRDDLRPRRTPGPLVRRLRDSDTGLQWGLRPAALDAPTLAVSREAGDKDLPLRVDPEASHLIVLLFSPAQGIDRRRDAIIEVRDWPDAPPDYLHTARDLVLRCARRLRRRGVLQQGRWFVP